MECPAKNALVNCLNKKFPFNTAFFYFDAYSSILEGPPPPLSPLLAPLVSFPAGNSKALVYQILVIRDLALYTPLAHPTISRYLPSYADPPVGISGPS